MKELRKETTAAVERVTAWVGSVPSIVVHTFLFIGAFALGLFDVASWELVLLSLTTAVSLEAIYLAIFIQFTVNQHTRSLREVEEDIDEIQENVEELGEDIDEIQEDIDEIQEDVEEMTEEEKADETRKKNQTRTLEELTGDIRKILDDLEALKKGK